MYLCVLIVSWLLRPAAVVVFLRADFGVALQSSSSGPHSSFDSGRGSCRLGLAGRVACVVLCVCVGVRLWVGVCVAGWVLSMVGWGRSGTYTGAETYVC